MSKDIVRSAEQFNHKLSMARSWLSIDKKEVDRIEQEVLDFIMVKKAELEKLKNKEF